MITEQKRRSKGDLPVLSKIDMAYIAGLMDGEGHFSIAKGGYKRPWLRKRKSVTGKEYYPKEYPPCSNYTIRIGCATTSPTLKNWLLQHIGGSCAIYRQKTHWKECYKWHLYGANAQEKFILAVLPYLVIKREQANILLQFIRLNGIENPSEREDLYIKVRLLNRRGACPTTNTPNTSRAVQDQPFEVKIESELDGDIESVPMVT